MKKIQTAALGVALVAALTVGGAGAAFAYSDSGVHSKACPKWGRLDVYQKGSGNTWAPGDWSTSPQWNPTSTSYRWITDIQSSGTGGGNWRASTNGDITTATPSCSNVG